MFLKGEPGSQKVKAETLDGERVFCASDNKLLMMFYNLIIFIAV